ncbi:hypothetical protein CYMTET_42728 [Cymbomonas tetramitiformis]|uniref:Glycosyltransferase 2-like domain-containing protein n=1 Tax=Cymbomonas tetramitiformis TaxID=36881 RepID=A0AAE0C3Q1_9CHLO|nr:hypothetical protein CYMTET_42728 [Cymbomonas tetramitiformis]
MHQQCILAYHPATNSASRRITIHAPTAHHATDTYEQELFTASYLEHIYFEPSEKGLARKMLQSLHEGVVAARLVTGAAPDGVADWVNLHRHLPLQREPIPEARLEPPFVSVCLVHRNRPKLLQQAVGSIAGQDSHSLELVVVDNGSEGEDVRHLLAKIDEELRGLTAFQLWSAASCFDDATPGCREPGSDLGLRA